MEVYPAFAEGGGGIIKDIVFHCITCDDLYSSPVEVRGSWDDANDEVFAYAEKHCENKVNTP